MLAINVSVRYLMVARPCAVSTVASGITRISFLDWGINFAKYWFYYGCWPRNTENVRPLFFAGIYLLVYTFFTAFSSPSVNRHSRNFSIIWYDDLFDLSCRSAAQYRSTRHAAMQRNVKTIKSNSVNQWFSHLFGSDNRRRTNTR